VSEIPIDLVRRNFETNLFAPLVLTQGFIRKWVDAKKPGKIVFTSSMGGLFTPPGYAVYVSTKHALEAVAEAMQQELAPFGIKVQTINPGAYLTGYNEMMADTPFRWLDDSKNFTKRAAMHETFDSLLGTPEGRLDPAEMIEKMIEIVPADTGKFRNVMPQFVEDMLKKSQRDAWDKHI
jgi:NAD(P)-dependent dehydrogenase (short-subunit alcohol dehydrogenase family)